MGSSANENPALVFGIINIIPNAFQSPPERHLESSSPYVLYFISLLEGVKNIGRNFEALSSSTNRKAQRWEWAYQKNMKMKSSNNLSSPPTEVLQHKINWRYVVLCPTSVIKRSCDCSCLVHKHGSRSIFFFWRNLSKMWRNSNKLKLTKQSDGLLWCNCSLHVQPCNRRSITEDTQPSKTLTDCSEMCFTSQHTASSSLIPKAT